MFDFCISDLATIIKYHTIMFDFKFFNLFVFAVLKFVALFVGPHFAELMFVFQPGTFNKWGVHVVFNKCGFSFSILLVLEYNQLVIPRAECM